MNNIKKLGAIYVFALVAVMFFGNTAVHASEVTGTISSSASSSGSQSGGTIGGNVGGGSTVSGTLGGNSIGGSTISGTVSGGGTAGATGGSTISGTVGGTGGGATSSSPSGGGSGGVAISQNPGGGLVLGASTVAVTPNLPNSGVGPIMQPAISWSLIFLALTLLAMLVVYGIFIFERKKMLDLM